MAAILRVKHTHRIGGKWRWIPAPWMRKLGATSETLGPQLTAKNAARAEELNDLWSTANDGPDTPREGTMAWLIKDYEQSSWYAKLGKRTRENVDLALRDINDALGAFPVALIGRQAIRTCYEGVLAKRGLLPASVGLVQQRREACTF